MTPLRLILICFIALSFPALSFADMDMPTGEPSMSHAQKGPYDHAMAIMHKGMAGAAITGDADVDFVTGMIPHHQGAIDMAKVVLEKGKDPEIKKLAEGIVKAQESEIEMMKKWLASHPKE